MESRKGVGELYASSGQKEEEEEVCEDGNRDSGGPEHL